MNKGYGPRPDSCVVKRHPGVRPYDPLGTFERQLPQPA